MAHHAGLNSRTRTDHGNHYEVLDDARNVVGHIMLSDAAPPEMPWIWSISSGHHAGRKPTYGYEATLRGGHGGFCAGLASRITDLSLTQSGRRLEDYCEVIADGAAGRIMFFTAMPGGLPWVWSIAPGHGEDRTQSHGHDASKESALSRRSRGAGDAMQRGAKLTERIELPGGMPMAKRKKTGSLSKAKKTAKSVLRKTGSKLKRAAKKAAAATGVA
jgi:hypothetical protein